jgi:hypothetical protein
LEPVSTRIQELLVRVGASQGSTEPGDVRLRERLPSAGNLAALEREIAYEIASSLGRAGSKLEAALEQARRTLRLGFRRHTELLRLYPVPPRLPER